MAHPEHALKIDRQTKLIAGPLLAQSSADNDTGFCKVLTLQALAPTVTMRIYCLRLQCGCFRGPPVPFRSLRPHQVLPQHWLEVLLLSVAFGAQ